MDGYFIQKLEELKKQLDEKRIQSLDDAKTTLDDVIIDDALVIASEERAIDKAVRMAKDEKIITGEPEIIAALDVLNDVNTYHTHTRVKVENSNINYDALTTLINHYTDMSIMARSDGMVFNARNVNSWREAGIKQGDYVHLFAKCHKNDVKRAVNAIEQNIERVLGTRDMIDTDLNHYIVREVVLNDEMGYHMRPIAATLKGAELYDGDVYIRNPKTGTTCRANSIMTIMTEIMSESLLKGDKLQILFEPIPGDKTDEAFKYIKERV
jgi:phosphotransferase system HPr-like phosphotransfer protein